MVGNHFDFISINQLFLETLKSAHTWKGSLMTNYLNIVLIAHITNDSLMDPLK